METYVVIWYDLETEVCRDEVEATSQDDAITKATLMRNGKKPAPLVNATPKELM